MSVLIRVKVLIHLLVRDTNDGEVIAVLPAGSHVPVHITGKIGETTFEGVDIIRVIH